MNEKKLTDEVVVKALEHCSHNRSCEYCYHNDERGSGEIVCRSRLMGKSLDLIHRLQKENEELKSPKFASWKLKFFRLKEEFDKELAEHEEFAKKANAEIERLTEELDLANETIDRNNKRYERVSIERQKALDRVDYLEDALLDKIRRNEELITAIKQAEQQAVKDTAKEICDLILEHWEKKQFVECDWLRVTISERYGVEVE